MAHEEMVMELMDSLVIADKHIIGDLMAHKGLWNAGTSSVNNSYKVLCGLTDQDKLVKGNGYFKLPNCDSEYKEHSQLLTRALADILKLNLSAQVIREPSIKEVGLRPDALVFLTKDERGLCIVLEVCNNEFPEYLIQKINVWKNWKGAKEKLSELFNTPIQDFDFVVSGDFEAEAFELQSYLKEVMNEKS